MILLTKIDNSTLILNLDAVKYIESVPDTVITFLNGDTMIVKESLEDVIESVVRLKANISYKAQCFAEQEPFQSSRLD